MRPLLIKINFLGKITIYKRIIKILRMVEFRHIIVKTKILRQDKILDLPKPKLEIKILQLELLLKLLKIKQLVAWEYLPLL